MCYNISSMNSETPQHPLNKPSIYQLLDQRVAPHGKSLHMLLMLAADAIKITPSSIPELDSAVKGFLGSWSPDPSPRCQPQSILAMEHLRLMNDRSATEGVDVAIAEEMELQHMVKSFVAKYRHFGLLVWTGAVTPAADVDTENAWAALNQRMMLEGIQLHEAVQTWVVSRARILLATPPADTYYMQLAQQLTGTWPSSQDRNDRFHAVFAGFLDAISSAKGQGAAVVIQTHLCHSFSRSIRKNLKLLQTSEKPQGDLVESQEPEAQLNEMPVGS
jgi:hypothetical protein